MLPYFRQANFVATPPSPGPNSLSPFSPLSGSGKSVWGGGTEIAQMPGSNLAARHHIYDVRLPNGGKHVNNLRAKAQRRDTTDTNISI